MSFNGTTLEARVDELERELEALRDSAEYASPSYLRMSPDGGVTAQFIGDLVGAIVGGDGSPPASSPTPSVDGALGYLAVTWAAVANRDPVFYDVHVSTASGFTPDATTKFATLVGTSTVIRRLPAGGYLTTGTTYYVKIVANDVDGAAPASAQGSAQLVGGGADHLPPASSPAPTVQGGIGALVVKWSAIANADPVTYDVHVSTASGFTPDGTTLAGSVDGTLFYVRKLPDGSALSYTTTYFVKLVARDIDGSAAASAQASGSPVQIVGGATGDIAADTITANELAANSITSDEIVANAITADKLAAVLVLASLIKTANTGQRVEIDSAGIRMYGSDGVTVLVNIPSGTGAPTFSGAVHATELDLGGPGLGSQVRWLRQADGLQLANVYNQEFGAAPNRQSLLNIEADEPDAGATGLAGVQVRLGRGGNNTAKTLLQDWPPAGITSDWLLQENLIAGSIAGTVIYAAADTNLRIYDMSSLSVEFVSNNVAASFLQSGQGRIIFPIAGLWLFGIELNSLAGSPSVTIFPIINGATVLNGQAATVGATASGAAPCLSHVGIRHFNAGDQMQYAGSCSSGGTRGLKMWAVRLPFDPFDSP